jgi:hypothetical protein
MPNFGLLWSKNMYQIVVTETVTNGDYTRKEGHTITRNTYHGALSYAFALIACHNQTVNCFYGSSESETENGARIDCECDIGKAKYKMQIIISEKAV